MKLSEDPRVKDYCYDAEKQAYFFAVGNWIGLIWNVEKIKSIKIIDGDEYELTNKKLRLMGKPYFYFASIRPDMKALWHERNITDYLDLPDIEKIEKEIEIAKDLQDSIIASMQLYEETKDEKYKVEV